METYRQDISRIIFQLAETGIIPSQEYYEEGKRLANKVFVLLQKKSRFSIAKVLISGSIGKKTGIIEPDLDLVIAINNFDSSRSAYEKVLDEFEQIFMLNARYLEIQEETIEQSTQYSVQFKFKNGIDVDLLPAANLEAHEVKAIIARDPGNYYRYNLSLAEKQMAFVKSHSSNFVHCLIRLLKFWFKSLVGVGKISGKGYILEVIGVAAAADEEDGSQDILRAFTRAIDWICGLKSLKLAFNEVADNKWIRVVSTQLTYNNASLVPSVVGTWEILRRPCFIIDPCNAYSDFLGALKPAKIDKLMEFAAETRRRLSALMNQNPEYLSFDGTTNTLHVDILQLFHSQPSETTREYPLAIPKDYYINCGVESKSLCCSMDVGNEQVFKDRAVRNFVEALKWNLVCGVKSSIHGHIQTQRLTEHMPRRGEAQRERVNKSVNQSRGNQFQNKTRARAERSQ